MTVAIDVALLLGTKAKALAPRLNERPVPAGGKIVHARGKERLARAALTDNQAGFLDRGQARDVVKDIKKGGILARDWG